MNLDPLQWHKSSYSGQTGGDCLEFAQPSRDIILVRDSKRTDCPHLSFTPQAWTGFLAAARKMQGASKR